MLFIQPGKPDHNAFIERFNRTYRNEVLDQYLFETTEQVQLFTENGSAFTTTKRALASVPDAVMRWSSSTC